MARELSQGKLEAFAQERIAVLDNFRTLELVSGRKTRRKRTLNADKGFAAEAAAFADACRSGRPAISLDSLLDTSRVTFAVVAALGRSFDLELVEARLREPS